MFFATLAAHSSSNSSTGLATERYHKFRLIIHRHIPWCRPGTPQVLAAAQKW